MISAGMIAMPKPMPVPGNWMNARTASNRAKPAMISANRRAHGWSAQRPRAASSQTIPVPTASQPHSPTLFELGKVAERPEPVEADHAQPEEQEAESRECREETEDRDEDGRVLHVCLLWVLLVVTRQ